MQKITILWLASLLIGVSAHALTVREGDIAGKTDLVAIADTSVNGQMESILTDISGFSLYTFKLDSSGVSKCAAGCLAVWPPLHVPSGAKVNSPFGTITGNDGQIQLTLNGLPLYHYVADKKPGNTFGVYPNWDAIVVTN